MEAKRRIDPKAIETKDLHQYLLGSVAPRPIAFVSTKNEDGSDNLAPYSFFNAFSSNPPILVFSSNRRVRDNTTKDTLKNIGIQREAVVNVVNYDIVRQMSLASVEFAEGISEFEQSGLTPVPSEMVRAQCVAESPVNMECIVKDIVTLGKHGGAGHLIICEVVLMHVAERVLDGDRIDPHKMDLMGRMGRAYYVRASGDAIHTIYQNILATPLGYPALPASIRHSTVLTANEVAQMASLAEWPDAAALTEARAKIEERTTEEDVHRLASALIAEDRVEEALAVCLAKSKP